MENKIFCEILVMGFVKIISQGGAIRTKEDATGYNLPAII
jgi:hypothetical protein